MYDYPNGYTVKVYSLKLNEDILVDIDVEKVPWLPAPKLPANWLLQVVSSAIRDSAKVELSKRVVRS